MAKHPLRSAMSAEEGIELCDKELLQHTQESDTQISHHMSRKEDCVTTGRRYSLQSSLFEAQPYQALNVSEPYLDRSRLDGRDASAGDSYIPDLTATPTHGTSSRHAIRQPTLDNDYHCGMESSHPVQAKANRSTPPQIFRSSSLEALLHAMDTNLIKEYAIPPPNESPLEALDVRTTGPITLPSLGSFYDRVGHSGLQSRQSAQPRLCHVCSRVKPSIRDVALLTADIDNGSDSLSNANSEGRSESDLTMDDAKSHVQMITRAIRDLEWYRDTISQRSRQDSLIRRSDIGRSGKSTTHTSLKDIRAASSSNRYHDGHSLPTSGRKRARSQSPMRGESALPEHDVNIFAKCARYSEHPWLARIESMESQSLVLEGGTSPSRTENIRGLSSPDSLLPETPFRRTLPLPSLAHGMDSIWPRQMAAGVHPPHPAVDSTSLSRPSTYLSSTSASTSSAASTHATDLRRQITPKSLSFQTLQSEYSNLLQRLQRETIRTQTIDKKSRTAEQEINTLTTRNEELAEQLKSLQQRLDERELKTSELQTQHAGEKGQWIRMLDMSTKMQAKHMEASQEWAREKASLLATISEPGKEHAHPVAGADKAADKAPNTETDQEEPVSSPDPAELLRLRTRVRDLSHTVSRLRTALVNIRDESEQSARVITHASRGVVKTVEDVLAAASGIESESGEGGGPVSTEG